MGFWADGWGRMRAESSAKSRVVCSEEVGAGAVLGLCWLPVLAAGLELRFPSARPSLTNVSLGAGHRAGFGLPYSTKAALTLAGVVSGYFILNGNLQGVSVISSPPIFLMGKTYINTRFSQNWIATVWAGRK